MEDSPKYEVGYVAAAPAASLTDEAFRQQVAAYAQQADPHYLACTSISHRPAHVLPGGLQLAEVAYYNVQVWDLRPATKSKPSGDFCFVAQGETAAGCLAALTTKLAEAAESASERALRELHADPTRFGSQQVASHLALTEAA